MKSPNPQILVARVDPYRHKFPPHNWLQKIKQINTTTRDFQAVSPYEPKARALITLIRTNVDGVGDTTPIHSDKNDLLYIKNLVLKDQIQQLRMTKSICQRSFRNNGEWNMTNDKFSIRSYMQHEGR